MKRTEALSSILRATGVADQAERKLEMFDAGVTIRIYDVSCQTHLVQIDKGGVGYEEVMKMTRSSLEQALVSARDELSRQHQAYVEMTAAGSCKAKEVHDD